MRPSLLRKTVPLLPLLLSLLARTSAYAAVVYVPGHHVTAGNPETWYGVNTYVVQGGITVDAGARLTVESGAVVKINPNLYFTVYGTLSASGATFTWADGVNEWNGIRFETGSDGSVLDNCTLERANGIVDRGVVTITNSSPTIRGCTIRDTPYASTITRGIYVTGGSASPVISGCTMTGVRVGIVVNTYAHPQITGYTYSGAGIGGNLEGIYVGSASPTITGCTIRDSYYGIYITSATNYESSPEISGCTIANTDYGIYAINSTSVPVVTGNVLDNNTHGIHLYDAAGTYRLNTIRGGGLAATGILIESPSLSSPYVPVFDNNHVLNHRNGIWVQTWGRANVTGNLFENNAVGLYHLASTTEGTYQGNRFRGNTTGIVRTGTGTVVDARFNHWGHPTGPYHPSTNPNGLGDKVSDHVEYYPWLAAEGGLACYGGYNTLYLRGGVKDAATGRALDNVLVDAGNGNSGMTDANGEFSIGPLPAGSYFLDLWKTGFYPNSKVVALCEGDARVDAVLTTFGSLFGVDILSGVIRDPVNTSTGNYALNRIDLGIPGVGIPFVFERSYNSQDNASGPLGYGWNHVFNPQLLPRPDNVVTVRWGDGRIDAWTPDGAGGYTPQAGLFDNLVRHGDGSWSVTRKNRVTFRFLSGGRLDRIEDRNGNALRMQYAGENLAGVVDTAGRAVSFSLDGTGRITRLTDPAGRTVEYAYDLRGDLVSWRDPEGHVTTCQYDAGHQLLKMTDPRGNDVVANVYDAQRRVVTTQRDAKGGATAFSYDEALKRTAITDPLGGTTYHFYDERLRLVRDEDPLGHAATYAFDDNGNRTEVRDRNGDFTRYGYDSRGNVTSVTDPLGHSGTISWDGRDNPLVVVDLSGGVTRFSWDDRGNLLSRTDAGGGVTSFGYDARGLPVMASDPDGFGTALEWDGEGNLAAVTDPLGRTSAAAYDGIGRRISTTDALGRTTSVAYDNNFNVLSVTDPLSGVTAAAYDGNGNRVSVTDPKGRTTRFVYDVKNLPVTVEDPLGNRLTIGYDALDRRVRVTDRNGNGTLLEYDAAGNLVRVTDPLGRAAAFSHDANGNRLTATDPLGNVTRWVYDALGRSVSLTDPLGNARTWSYDASGRVLSTTDAVGRTTRFEHDPVGRLTRVEDAAGGAARYVYSNAGKLISISDPKGNVTAIEYDGNRRPVRVTEALGNATTYAWDNVGNLLSRTDASGNATTYGYDAGNRRVLARYADGATVAYEYDAAGNRTRMTDATGATAYAYDPLNRLLSVTDGGGRTVGYAYDPEGNITSLAYPDGKTVSYAYDASGRMSSVTDWRNDRSTYTYDAAGRVVRLTLGNGVLTEYGYDAAGRMTSLANRKGSGELLSVYSFVLDPAGNHVREDSTGLLPPVFEPGETGYSYDAENRLTAAGGQAANHDPNGNLTSWGPYSFLYDAANRLREFRGGTGVKTFRYDGDGKRASVTDGGVQRSVVFDVNRPLPEAVYESEGGTATHYVYGLSLLSRISGSGALYYTYDYRGSTVVTTDGAGREVDRYFYDPYGRVLSSVEGTPRQRYRYGGAHGLVDDGDGLIHARSRYYLPAFGRFLTRDSLLVDRYDTQTLNRYVYAKDSPVIYIDKDGRFAVNLVAAGTGFVIGGIVGGSFELAAQLAGGKDFRSVDWRGVIGASAGGAVGGAITGACLGLCKPVGGAVGEILEKAIGTKEEGSKIPFLTYKPEDYIDVAFSAALSGLGGKKNISERISERFLGGMRGREATHLYTALFGAHGTRSLINEMVNGYIAGGYEAIQSNLASLNTAAGIGFGNLTDPTSSYFSTVCTLK